jgi:hypothetical protein
VAVNEFLTIAAPIPADITADSIIGIDDLLAIINAWTPIPWECPHPCLADVNGDGSVNIDDLLAVINAWG